MWERVEEDTGVSGLCLEPQGTSPFLPGKEQRPAEAGRVGDRCEDFTRTEGGGLRTVCGHTQPVTRHSRPRRQDLLRGTMCLPALGLGGFLPVQGSD